MSAINTPRLGRPAGVSWHRGRGDQGADTGHFREQPRVAGALLRSQPPGGVEWGLRSEAEALGRGGRCSFTHWLGTSGESHDLCEPQFLTCKVGMTHRGKGSVTPGTVDAHTVDTQEMLSPRVKYLRFWWSWGSSLFSLSLDVLIENLGASLDPPVISERSPSSLQYQST